MKKLYLSLVLLAASLSATAQVKVFTLSYGKTFVSNDSSNAVIKIQLNKDPGTPPGGYFFVNRLLKTNTAWRYYFKPMADVNLGSGTASAPNNISVGLSGGYAYDLKKYANTISTLYFEGSPEAVGDKSFKNVLYYGKIGSYIKLSSVAPRLLAEGLLGVNMAAGTRAEQAKTDHFYSRGSIPLYLKLGAWPDSAYVNGKNTPFKRLVLTHSFKYSHLFSDDRSVTSQRDYFYNSTELDVYITPNIGITFTYNNGHDEPVFIRNNAYTVGITIAHP